MTTTQRNMQTAIEHAIIPRAGRLPVDANQLLSSAILGFCPVKTVERRERSAAIADMIGETLAEAIEAGFRIQ